MTTPVGEQKAQGFTKRPDSQGELAEELLKGFVRGACQVLQVCPEQQQKHHAALKGTAELIGLSLLRIRRADKGEMGREQRDNHCKNAFNEHVLNKTDAK